MCVSFGMSIEVKKLLRAFKIITNEDWAFKGQETEHSCLKAWRRIIEQEGLNWGEEMGGQDRGGNSGKDTGYQRSFKNFIWKPAYYST